MPDLASKYATLRTRLVDYKLNILGGCGTDPPHIRAGSSGMSSSVDFVAAVNPEIISHASFPNDVRYAGMYDSNSAFRTGSFDDPMLGMVDEWEALDHATWHDLGARQGPTW